MRFAEVAVDAPWTRNRTFSYSVPEHLPLELAHSVWVPFGRRVVQGIVFEITPHPAVEETKEIISVIDPSPLLTPSHLELARWISQHYLASLFDTTALMLPPGFRRRVLAYYSLKPGVDVTGLSLSPPQSKLLEYLQKEGPSELRNIKKALGGKAATAAEQLSRRGLLVREWNWARPSVGPKFASVVRLAVSKQEAVDQLKALNDRRATRQSALLEALLQRDGPVSMSELKDISVGLPSARALEARGLVAIERVRVHRDPLKFRRYETIPPPVLNQHQQEAWEAISQELKAAEAKKDRQEPAVFLLHGVTGSGKTELYLRALGQAVANGKKGLVLVPEISLTPQTIQRFGSRFPNRVAVLHSKLSLGEQFDEWWQIKEGEFDVVIGSRSALFAPQPNLGLIVIDEEHDTSYKQTDPSPRYHTREVALKLARLTGATLIMGSATPDVSSYYRASREEFRLLELPTRIVTNGSAAHTDQQLSPMKLEQNSLLPGVEVVDQRTELKEGNRSIFSRTLAYAMDSALSAGEQIILFLNRRGSATFIQCRECGHSLRCRRCDVSLTYHSAWKRLVCHHCGYKASPPGACPRCGSSRISYLGIGTQRVEEEVVGRFPEARVLRWDRDVTRGKLSHEKILEKFLAHEADVLIGTQMIAKGLHMPRVTLVGVISADVGINLPDFRAGERVFQVLSQVAGRAGRGPLGGRVIVQTFNPRHYAIVAAAHHDYRGFYNQEIGYRRHHGYPPFNNMVRLVYSHTNTSYAQREASRMSRLLVRERDSRGLPDTHILGPMPCFVPRVRGRYRWQILVRTPNPSGFLENIDVPERWVVDIDPLSLL